MTKAKARLRAKANAAKKAKKRAAAAKEEPAQNLRPGQFDPGPGSITGPAAGVNTRNIGGARRGAARSR